MAKKIGKLFLVGTSLLGVVTLGVMGYQKYVELKKALDVECDFLDCDCFTHTTSTLTKNDTTTKTTEEAK